MINKADSFEAELKQLRFDLKDGAISRGNYEKAVKEVLVRKDVAKLEPLWWARYKLKDAPVSWMNPHFESIWQQASPDKQDIALMAIGVLREPNSRVRVAKYVYLKEQLEKQGVYIDVSSEQILRGNQKANQIVIAAVMETYTNTGLYAKK